MYNSASKVDELSGDKGLKYPRNGFASNIHASNINISWVTKFFYLHHSYQVRKLAMPWTYGLINERQNSWSVTFRNKNQIQIKNMSCNRELVMLCELTLNLNFLHLMLPSIQLKILSVRGTRLDNLRLGHIQIPRLTHIHIFCSV